MKQDTLPRQTAGHGCGGPTDGSDTDELIRFIAFYLPQYHPIPENDQWWGRGFTEWNKVVQARPLFRGHYQPHLPADLGFYDLRLEEVRQAQARLARQYGIHGFCYYHYWFHGRRLLERPFNEVLESGRPDFPFCLCWANENWTRAWDGGEKQILMPQTYSHEDNVRHIEWLCRAFRDRRYIRVSGKPLFLIYRASRIENIEAMLDVWRQEALKHGVGELFLAAVESFPTEHRDWRQAGFDASVEFQPDWGNLPDPVTRGWVSRCLRRLGVRRPSDRIRYLYRYADTMRAMLNKKPAAYPRVPCVTPSWDNSARRQANASVFIGSTPQLFERWLQQAVARHLETRQDPAMDVFFLNAWNEWAEGNHLEPCQRWGHGYLEAVKNTLGQYRHAGRASSRHGK